MQEVFLTRECEICECVIVRHKMSLIIQSGIWQNIPRISVYN